MAALLVTVVGVAESDVLQVEGRKACCSWVATYSGPLYRPAFDHFIVQLCDTCYQSSFKVYLLM